VANRYVWMGRPVSVVWVLLQRSSRIAAPDALQLARAELGLIEIWGVAWSGALARIVQ